MPKLSDYQLPDEVTALIARAKEGEITPADFCIALDQYGVNQIRKMLYLRDAFNISLSDAKSIITESEYEISEGWAEEVIAAVEKISPTAVGSEDANTGIGYSSVQEELPPDVKVAVETIELFIRNGLTLDDACKRVALMLSSPIIDTARKEIEKKIRRIRTLREPPALEDPNLLGWYTGPQEIDRFWPALKTYLVESKHWNQYAIQMLDDASTKVLSLMPPPGLGTFSTRGLVLGYVQSGKTANFTAVISKAADVGYKFFIVLSGVTNKLRNQTQERLDLDIQARTPGYWATLTTINQDFRQPGNVDVFLTENHKYKILAVVKKHSGRLGQLLSWLGGASEEVIRNCPVLIIDDEADQASVNTGQSAEERSKVNQCVIDLLKKLPKVAYVGYTATPFANFLVDPSLPEDLYPRDFIVDLPKPEGYFGPESIFGREQFITDESDVNTDGYNMIRLVPVDEIPYLQPASRNNRDAFRPRVTSQLKEALNYFWMATAARNFRGQTDQHSTMLLHTTSYVDAQSKFEKPISDYREQVLRRLEEKDPAFIAQLQETWKEETDKVKAANFGLAAVPFSEILTHLEDVIQRTEIAVENYLSTNRLNYERRTPGVFIVIGGNILARGLTLEGLIVSLFIRTSSAYDTLLQMGRWFGFRPGYADLPRVWMTEELKTYFYDLATVEHEIRQEIKRYELERLTPLDFSVRIRTHKVLSITSKLKMQHAVDVAISFESSRLQTTKFKHKDQKWLLNNLEETRSLIQSMKNAGYPEIKDMESNFVLFRDVKSEYILDFISKYSFHEKHADLNPKLLNAYIKEQNQKGDITVWNVAVMSQHRYPVGTENIGLDEEIPLINRSRLKLGPFAAKEYADIKALMSKADILADRNISGVAVQDMKTEELISLRGAGEPGLLLIYPIAKDSKPIFNAVKKSPKEIVREPLDAEETVIGVGIVFPKATVKTPQGYKTVDLSGVLREEPEDFIEEDEAA